MTSMNSGKAASATMKRFVVLTAVLLSMLIAAPMAANAYQTGALQADKTTVQQLQQLRLQGVGFKALTGVLVQGFSDPVTLANVNANAAGAIDVTVTIPTTLGAGNHTIVASGLTADGTDTLQLSVPITVTALPQQSGTNATTSTTKPLARTGSSNTVPWALIGVSLVTVGALLVVAVRRRRTA